VGEHKPSRIRERLHFRVARRELVVRTVEREPGVYAALATHVDDSEQQVTQLTFEQIMIHWRQMLRHFFDLLAHFRHWPVGVGPIESNARRAILQPMRAVQGGQARRNAFVE
jgi:hypothetical protein